MNSHLNSFSVNNSDDRSSIQSKKSTSIKKMSPIPIPLPIPFSKNLKKLPLN